MRFQPVGAQISDKNVSEKMVNFIATKKLLFVSKSVYVNGVLESSADNQVCPPDDVGYILKMHFDSSDPLVINNVKGLEAILCLHSKSDSSIEGIVQSKIIIGSNYSKTFGPITINLIKEQIAPLLSALTEEVKSLR